MKYIIILLFVSVFSYSTELPPLDPDEPVFQAGPFMPNWALRTHPGLREVHPMTLQDMELYWDIEFTQKNRRTMWNRGFMFLSIGLPLAIAGFLFSGIIAHYAGQLIGHLITPTGITLAVTGAALMQLAELWVLITIGCIIILIYGIFSYILKDKGITASHVKAVYTTLKRSKNNGNN